MLKIFLRYIFTVFFFFGGGWRTWNFGVKIFEGHTSHHHRWRPREGKFYLTKKVRAKRHFWTFPSPPSPYLISPLISLHPPPSLSLSCLKQEEFISAQNLNKCRLFLVLKNSNDKKNVAFIPPLLYLPSWRLEPVLTAVLEARSYFHGEHRGLHVGKLSLLVI